MSADLIARLLEIETDWRNLAPIEIKSRIREAIAALTAMQEGKALRERVRELEKVADILVRLEPNYVNCGPSEWVGSKGAVFVSDLRTARRVREGGKV